MSELFKILGQSNPSTTNTTLYTCPAQTQTVISVVTIANTTGGALTARLYAVPVNVTLSVDNALMYGKSISANTTDTTIKGITLRGGDTLVCYASATGLVYSAFGSEIS